MSDLPDVINWRRLGEHITTSGQPTEAQLAEIKALGVTHIINLGPHTNKGALRDEAGFVKDLGMTYIYIPVDFEAPTEADFEVFCDAMRRLEGLTTHVHCIYNARVSAFFYRYAVAGTGDREQMLQNMDGIWRPGGVWANFIGKPQETQYPNRYAGDDY